MVIQRRYVPLLFLMCVHCLQEKKKFWRNLFNIFLDLLSISVLVSYGMHSFHTSEYNYVYICYIEKQIYNNVQKKKKNLHTKKHCIRIVLAYTFLRLWSQFFLETCIQMYIYFLDFYPATRMWTENPVTIQRNAVILTITCVYSRVVDMSKEKSIFVIIFNYFVTATLWICILRIHHVGLYLLSSITWHCLPPHISDFMWGWNKKNKKKTKLNSKKT